jgi:valyl-tRNA synthetase
LATYKYWLENVKDWCIAGSFGGDNRIPAWYDKEGRFVVAENGRSCNRNSKAKCCIPEVWLTQDEDVLDTWFSSWLWPMEVF